MSDINKPSDFWKKLGDYHNRQLSQSGIGNFKRTVNRKYFNWGVLGIYSHQLTPLIWCLKKRKFFRLFESRFKSTHKEFNFLTAFLYKIYLAALFEYVSSIDELGLFNKIDEPAFGNPFLVSYQGKTISQDLSNSVFEFYSITKAAKMAKSLNILEIGAGYGRLAYIFLKAFPDCSYTIVDIEPAFSVSKLYLKRVMPEDGHRLQFFPPEEVEDLADKSFNMVISISSFQEMTLKQIKYYFSHINRLCKGYFYTKQLKRSWIRENSFISENNYPQPADWKKIYKRTHPIQKFFFEALYRIS